jgi:hypothetical protein
MLRMLLSGLLLLCAFPAFAIYKCDSGGKVSYSDTLCPGGAKLDIDNEPPRDAATARRKAAQDEKKLERLETDHRKRKEREDKAWQRTAKSGAALHRKCATLARKQKWAEEDATAAAGKTSAKAKRKAERASETYQSECSDLNSRGLSFAG